MSPKVVHHAPPPETPSPPSLSDANDAEHHSAPAKTAQQDNHDSWESPPSGSSTAPVASSDGSIDESPLERFLRSLAPNVSLVLENSGSVARDHLANERTWLAYVRTSLSIAGTGVALVQLFTISESVGHAEKLLGTGVSLRNFARPLGAATVLLALCILGIGVSRYFAIQTAMAKGLFPAARNSVIMITVVLAALVAITFGVLVALPS